MSVDRNLHSKGGARLRARMEHDHRPAPDFRSAAATRDTAAPPQGSTAVHQGSAASRGGSSASHERSAASHGSSAAPHGGSAALHEHTCETAFVAQIFPQVSAFPATDGGDSSRIRTGVTQNRTVRPAPRYATLDQGGAAAPVLPYVGRAALPRSPLIPSRESKTLYLGQRMPCACWSNPH